MLAEGGPASGKEEERGDREGKALRTRKSRVPREEKGPVAADKKGASTG